MSVFTASTPNVELPITNGKHQGGDSVVLVAIFDPFDAEPWIEPCENCTVITGESASQTGCERCRGRGWFNTETGLPVKVWWWQTDLGKAANWLLHTFTPTLLRAAGHNDDAERVAGLPKVTADRLDRRIQGAGLLEDISERANRTAWGLLEQHPDGGRMMPRDWRGHDHPVWARARDARLDVCGSRVGLLAFLAAENAANVIRVRREQGESTVDLDALLDDLLDAYEAETAGAIMLEQDAIHGPDRPALHGKGGTRCEARYERDGVLYRCDVTVPPRADVHHTATTPAGVVAWADADTAEVQCPSTHTYINAAGQSATVQCDLPVYRHAQTATGLLDHTWMDVEPLKDDDYADFRAWTDEIGDSVPNDVAARTKTLH